MTAYYNEIEPYCCAWLKNLQGSGAIADGVVDDTPIEETSVRTLQKYTQLHFFAGIGAWSYALKLVNWPDDHPVWTGSCPCQPFSNAGLRKGLDDERHLFPEWFKRIELLEPPIIFGEQVASKLGIQWLDSVLSLLENIGYITCSAKLYAGSVGLPHRRGRLFWAAAHPVRYKQPRALKRVRHVMGMGRIIKPLPPRRAWRSTLHHLRAVDDGTAYGVGATDAVRNTIVPAVAASFVESFSEAWAESS